MHPYGMKRDLQKLDKNTNSLMSGSKSVNRQNLERKMNLYLSVNDQIDLPSGRKNNETVTDNGIQGMSTILNAIE